MLDLHGLHVKEAVECVTAHLTDFINGRLREATLITGSGHHTLGPNKGEARLLPAIESLCVEKGLRYEYVADTKGFEGAIKVFLA